MEKSQILLDLLLPTDQKTTRPIEPGMRAFHYPSASPKARRGNFLLLFLPTPANMRKLVMSFDLLTDGQVIIPSIQTQVLRLRLRWREDRR